MSFITCPHEVPVVSGEDVLDRSRGVLPGELLDCHVASRRGADPFQGMPPLVDLSLGLFLVASKSCYHLVPGSLVHGLGLLMLGTDRTVVRGELYADRDLPVLAQCSPQNDPE